MSVQANWQRWLKQWSSLFSPGYGECALCRKRCSNGAGICSSCQAMIPWIDEIRCLICGRPEACPDCTRRTAYFVMNRAAVRYSADMKRWLSHYKYRGDERLGELFAGMLFEAYKRYMITLAEGKGVFDLISYVPVSGERLEERGFNQAEQMALGLSRRCRLPVISLLVRTRHTGKQSFKVRAERLADLHGAFAVDPKGIAGLGEMNRKRRSERRSWNILLIDDVYTTGSTLDECSKVLRESLDAQVYGLTWGR
jgi:competence protein ComFC